MEREMWIKFASAMAGVWPASKLNDDDQEVWYSALADLESGHVAAALDELVKTSKFRPTVAEIRIEAARQEVRMRPQLPVAISDDGRYITLRVWRAAGYPGIEEWGLTPEDAERITHGGTRIDVPR